MIPRANITAWSTHAPWPASEQVEQDLVLSRALVDMFSLETVANHAAFRGGTALHKLFATSSRRYSDDIDLVQIQAGPIGGLVNAIRASVDPWLGTPTWRQSHGRFTLFYRFETTFAPVTTMRLKIEINTREHFSVLPIERRRFEVDNPWFNGTADLPTYHIDELLGTKMRALYQRKKGRDLYDLWIALQSGETKSERIVRCFRSYMDHQGLALSRAEYEESLAGKFRSRAFLEDIRPLISPDAPYDPVVAAEFVGNELISRLPGEPWKGAGG